VSCERWTDAISAMADGEDPGVDERLLRAHLDRCVACRVFASEVSSSRTRLRVGEADPMPDLSGRVAKRVALADRILAWRAVRALLVACAVQILLIAAPALFLGSEHGASEHDARHLGAFTAAYGVGLIVVAVRPARARTMLPVAVVLAASLAVTALIDIGTGHTEVLSETTHLPELASVGLVWLLARPKGRRSASPMAGTVLRPVEALDADEEASG
jgi:predicted anti-sigma-YlaC factor YlaD